VYSNLDIFLTEASYAFLEDLNPISQNSKGLFTQAIFVAATGCNICRNKIASSFKHVRNPCDIAATNRTKNRTWFTRAILKLQP